MEFLETNNILCDFQHGFRRGYSTMTQLTEFVHDNGQSLDIGIQVDAIFIDLSKAFDTVPHSKLLHKLNLILNNHHLVTGYPVFFLVGHSLSTLTHPNLVQLMYHQVFHKDQFLGRYSSCYTSMICHAIFRLRYDFTLTTAHDIT